MILEDVYRKKMEKKKRKTRWGEFCLVNFLMISLFSEQLKLDQETWLCRTHLDDIVVKNWTILDHIRSYHTIS